MLRGCPRTLYLVGEGVERSVIQKRVETCWSKRGGKRASSHLAFAGSVPAILPLGPNQAALFGSPAVPSPVRSDLPGEGTAVYARGQSEKKPSFLPDLEGRY